MKPFLRFTDDGTLEIAIFAPGDHHGTGEPITQAQINQLIASYDPDVHEAPSVIGHAEDRGEQDPAYGWVDKLFMREGMLWARLKQVPAEFKEWIEAGYWKKRSVEIYTNWMDSGKLYLRAIAWLGAQPPAVKGMPDVVFKDDGDYQVLDFAEDRESRLRQAWTDLKALFGDEDEEPAGEIAQQMAREDALQVFDRVKWIASDELYELIYYSPDMDPEEKRGKIRALFDELKQLIESIGDEMVAAFTEQEDSIMDGNKTVQLTEEELAAKIEAATTGAVATALEAFSEKQDAIIQAKVQEGVNKASEADRRRGVKLFCDRLKERGFNAGLVDEKGMLAFLERLDFQNAVVFAEGENAKEQTPKGWFEEFVEDIITCAQKGTLLVPKGEIPRGPGGENEELDDEAWAIQEYHENRETYEKLGHTLEDVTKQAPRLRVRSVPELTGDPAEQV